MMTKRITGLLLIVCMNLFLFTGCRGIQLEPQPYGGDNMELYTIAAFSIPYADRTGTKIRTIEEDQYGRVLFLVSFRSSGFYYQSEYEKMYAYAVCQKSDEERTYYYEDDCFLLYLTEDMFTESEQNKLKELNDWDKPLNEAKMTSRQIIEPHDSKLRATSLGFDKAFSVSLHLKAAFLAEHPVDTDRQHVFYKYLDCDAAGKSVGVVWYWYYSDNDSNDTETEAYFIMVDEDCLLTNKAQIAKITDTLHFQDELKMFKAANNWVTR